VFCKATLGEDAEGGFVFFGAGKVFFLRGEGISRLILLDFVVARAGSSVNQSFAHGEQGLRHRLFKVTLYISLG
jgi:hypothetical protein